jgi:hypothetical protein
MLKFGVPIIVPASPSVRRGRHPRLHERHEDSKLKSPKQRPEIQPNDFFGPLSRQAKSNKSFVSYFIEERFNLKRLSAEIRENLKNKTTHRPKHRNYTLVGTAVDYRIRAYFSDQPHLCEAVSSGLSLVGGTKCKSSQASLNKLFVNTKPSRRSLEDFEEHRLCAYCVVVAQLDAIYRVGPVFAEKYVKNFKENKLEKIADTVDPEVVADLVQLSKGFRQMQSNLIKSFRRVHVGKSLPGSKDVIGADFDLLVDNCLFDFKTTIRPRDIRACLRQLIGYWLLDYDDRFRIRSIALCFTRQNYTHRFEISDLLPSPRSSRQIRRTFRNELRAFNRRTKSFEMRPSAAPQDEGG